MEFTGKRKTAAIVNLKHIKENLSTIKQFVGDKKICAIVKADAYGHGAVVISKFILKSGFVDYLGVATVEEGCELRDAGIKTPILLLGITFKDQYNLCVKNDLTVTVSSTKDITELNKVAGKLNKLVKTHLIIDTGMGRIGVRQENYENLTEEFLKSSNLNFEGIFSHFSDSSDNKYSGIQIQEFKKATEYFEKAVNKTLVKHMANSGGVLNLPESYFDMVRPGIILYGYKPYDNYSTKKILSPSMTLRTEISFVKYVKKGTVISYGADTFTKEDCYIATIPVGYADGISRSLSDKMQVKINNKIYYQIGRVTMDQTMIVLNQDLYNAGTEVLIFDDNSFSVDNYADLMGTIPYEVTCAISKRVMRYYKGL